MNELITRPFTKLLSSIVHRNGASGCKTGLYQTEEVVVSPAGDGNPSFVMLQDVVQTVRPLRQTDGVDAGAERHRFGQLQDGDIVGHGHRIEIFVNERSAHVDDALHSGDVDPAQIDIERMVSDQRLDGALPRDTARQSLAQLIDGSIRIIRIIDAVGRSQKVALLDQSGSALVQAIAEELRHLDEDQRHPRKLIGAGRRSSRDSLVLQI